MKILFLDERGLYGDLARLLCQQRVNDVVVVKKGAHAVRALQQAMFDLVIFELTVPVMSGLDLVRWVRHNLGKKIPVLALSGVLSDCSTADVLNAGADDWIRTPISKEDFIARVNVVMRRMNFSEESDDSVLVGSYLVPRGGRNIFVNNEPVKMTRKEFEIAATLFRNVGRVVPRHHLITFVWGDAGDTSSRSLDTHIYRVKNKLRLNGEHGLRLQSVYTFGYRLEKV
ncbi:response regulator transcription factor [Burkholderia anthina]|nr:response regulator transcription factor [Burkholderia anthina]